MSLKKTASLAALAFSASAMLAGCTPGAESSAPPSAPGASAAVTTATPATHASRTARLQAFLAKRYGASASLSDRWPGTWTQDGEARAIDWQVCAEQPVVSGDSWQQLLAVCGTLGEGGYAGPGTIDFYVLRPSGEGFEVAAELTGGTYVISGRPGTVQVIRTGSDFYGFRIESGWYGQGYSLETQTLILPGPKGLVDAGWLRSHIDNDAAYDCDDAEFTEVCRTRMFNLDFSYRFDDSDRSARTWPLVIEETGSECGGKPVRREHRFSLDAKTWTYTFPQALQREGCT